MKIAVRGGHNFSVPGARGIIDETTEDRKVKDAVIKYLKKLGHEVLDVTAPDSCNTVGSDLSYGVNKANNWRANLFISCHFNKAYTSYNGAIGTEVLVYSKRTNNDIATNILNKICSLGFKNRGIKERAELYELRRTNMKSIIIETCFIEATDDVELYKSVGADKIGKLIAEAISNKNVVDNATENKPTDKPSKGNKKPNKPKETSKDTWVGQLQKELNKQYNARLIVDYIAGPKTLSACPLVRYGYKGAITKLMQKRLIRYGVSCGKYGADGFFGNSTKTAVRNFQKMKGLYVDGIVGKNTWRKLLDF